MAVDQIEIAKRLGLSQTTVSLALRGSQRISDQTRDKVLHAAQSMGYMPNTLARGLRGAATQTVGVIWAFADPWVGDAIIAMELIHKLHDQAYAVYQAPYSSSPDVLCRQIDELLNRRVDAIILQAIPDELRNPAIARRLANIPTVALCREDVSEFGGDLVIHDRYDAIRQAVRHLAASGRKRPAFAVGIAQESNPPKYDVFTRACREMGLDDHPDMLIDLGMTRDPDELGELHRQAIRRQFPGRIDVDAIFAFNDIGAMFIMRELEDRGIRVGQDIAVIGFNDTQAGRVWKPALASGDRKPYQAASALADMVLRRSRQGELPPQRHTVPMEFIWRPSAGGSPPKPG